MSGAHSRQELPCNSRVGKFLRNSGLWLNVKRPGRCAPWGAQGVDTAYGSSYKGQAIRHENLSGVLSDFRPEAFAASFQTKRTQNISILSYEKTGSRYEIREGCGRSL